MFRSHLSWLAAITFLFSSVLTTNVLADKKLAVDKVDGDFSVMVLGSGGPIATSVGRASAGYLVFIEGEPKILMDAGGGTFQRLAQSGTDIKDLDIVLLTHLHIDHMGDLSPIVKSMYFHNRIANVDPNNTEYSFPPGRTAPFRVFGPAANGVPFPPVLSADPGTAQYPASSEFVHSHYDLNEGNERYLNIFSRAISGGIFGYEVTDVSPNWQNYNPVEIVNEDGLVITAVGVNHGPVPLLAFRIDYKGKSVVYSGDTSSVGNNMPLLSEGADLLIYDTALFFNAPPANRPDLNIFYALHTTPARIGQVASQANVKSLVLSHITPQTEGKFKAVKDMIRAEGYKRNIKVAKDLKVYNLLSKKDDDD